MAFKQVVKFKRKVVPEKITEQKPVFEEPKKGTSVKKNNTEKKIEEMDEKVNKAEEIMNSMKAAGNVKVVKKDKGLIERTESSKIVLTEDNRQVLND